MDSTSRSTGIRLKDRKPTLDSLFRRSRTTSLFSAPTRPPVRGASLRGTKCVDLRPFLSQYFASLTEIPCIDCCHLPSNQRGKECFAFFTTSTLTLTPPPKFFNNGLSSIQPKVAAFEAHNEKTQRGFKDSPMTSTACHNWCKQDFLVLSQWLAHKFALPKTASGPR